MPTRSSLFHNSHTHTCTHTSKILRKMIRRNITVNFSFQRAIWCSIICYCRFSFFFLLPSSPPAGPPPPPSLAPPSGGLAGPVAVVFFCFLPVSRTVCSLRASRSVCGGLSLSNHPFHPIGVTDSQSDEAPLAQLTRYRLVPLIRRRRSVS